MGDLLPVSCCCSSAVKMEAICSSESLGYLRTAQSSGAAGKLEGFLLSSSSAVKMEAICSSESSGYLRTPQQTGAGGKLEGFLLFFFFRREDGSDMFLRIVRTTQHCNQKTGLFIATVDRAPYPLESPKKGGALSRSDGMQCVASEFWAQ
jgi:hypothetical protein